MSKEKKVIGRFELVDFPDLGIRGMNAKIDTGAYSTAVHCNKIDVTKVGGVMVLDFEIEGKAHRFDEFGTKEVKNSFGDVEKRFIIKTKVRIGRRTVLATISLSDRAGMRFPVLIGRKLLKGRFVVDVSKEYLLSHKN